MSTAAEQHSAYGSLLENLRGHAIYVVDSEGSITLWTASAAHLFGYEEREVLGQHHRMLYAEEDRVAGVPSRQIAEARETGHHVDEHWHVRKDGSRFYAIVDTTPQEDEATAGGDHRFIKVAHDITARKRSEELIRHEAFHDKLTGLPNRNLFLEHLARAISYERRRATNEFAVFFLDVDNFKAINDTLGHPLADRVLIEIGQRLARALRPEDIIARMGGDEFAILVGDLHDREAALAVAQRLHDVTTEPYMLNGHEVLTSVSIGIAYGLPTYEQPEQVLRDADIAMYAAKSRGRAHFVLFDAPMQERVHALSLLETDLRFALDRGEFRIVYQPIVELDGMRLIGFEALVRWEHPTRGLLAPADFLSAAENTGLIVKIDRWVLEHACRRLGELQVDSSSSMP
ncbi:MAG TPA: diguanylate cyclase, partial [Candidatus Baltobacteraceae bacterium]